MKSIFSTHTITALLVSVLAAIAAGCGDDPAGPDAPESPPLPFYPLESGSRWTYGYTFAVEMYDPDTGAKLDADTSVADIDVRLTDADTVNSVVYLVEQTVFQSETGVDTAWVRLRQDEDGLYAAVIDRNQRTVGGNLAALPVALSEFVPLRYPLAPGAQWDVFPGSDAVTASVEALDTLDTPAGSMPAWRIRIDTFDQLPDDWHRVWYGRCGKIRDITHVEFIAIDPQTREAVRIVREESMTLEGIDLVEPRDCALETGH
jgi:hypothetical protein